MIFHVQRRRHGVLIGYSAYFVDLSPMQQAEIIARTEGVTAPEHIEAMSGQEALPPEGKPTIHGNVTESFKSTKGQSSVLCWAKALRHNAENITVNM